MTNFFTVGSEWRVWDLQVQTILDDGYIPLSRYYNTLKVEDPLKWNEYVSKVGGEANALKYDSKAYFNDTSFPKAERCNNYVRNFFAFMAIYKPEIGCIGLTDHNYWDDLLYDTFYTYSNRNELKVICGVEINVDGVHMLVFFSHPPRRKSTFSEGIKSFLESLDVTTPKEEGVLSLCRKDISEVISLIRREKGIYIYPHCYSDNGLFQERGRTDRTHLARIYNIKRTTLLQARSKHAVDQIITEIERRPNLKAYPIFSISPDSRSLKDVGSADAEGYLCWIKSNPGFKGLEQISYEPELRVHIGTSIPRKIQRSKIIKSITISNTNGWFNENLHINLNESQISVIGGKGSGKTALLDLIAFATNSLEYEDTSFLARATKSKSSPLSGAIVKVEWCEGTAPDERTIPYNLNKSNVKIEGDKKVLYLSQNYVEYLCRHDQVEALTKQIESVVFQKVPKEQKAGYLSFQEYKDSYLEIIEKEKLRINEELIKLTSAISDLKKVLSTEKELKTKKTKLIENLNELIKESAAVSNTNDEATIAKLNSLKEANNEVKETEQNISYLLSLSRSAEAFSYKIEQFLLDSVNKVAAFRQDALVLNIDESIVSDISISLFPNDLTSVILKKRQEIESNISTLNDVLQTKRQKAIELEGELTIENAKKERIVLLESKTSSIVEEMATADALLSKMNEHRESLALLEGQRLDKFCSYFLTLSKERNVLYDIYAPIKNDLSRSTESNRSLLEFVVDFNFDVDKMASDGERMIDHAKAGPFYHKDLYFLKSLLNRIPLDVVFSDESNSPLLGEEFVLKNADIITQYITQVKGIFDGASIEGQLKRGITEEDFDLWLFNTNHFKVGYNIQFNGTPLAQLSPGTKGMALLILFLELDSEDDRPILIDQPEENLDNRSVFETLRNYFRSTKNRRQIIIATHNPNLVVNTDSEQVIVANFSRKTEEQSSAISYLSGALECDFKNNNPIELLELKTIKEHICHVLEGGEDAFKQRERRYGLA